MSTDNCMVPTLWSAAEISVAVFSCSIPSLTHLFRRVITFTSPQSVERPRLQPASKKRIDRTALQRSNDRRQNGSFWRLRDESKYPRVSNLGLGGRYASTSNDLSRENIRDPLSYGLIEIMVTRTFDAGYDDSARV